MSKGADRTTDAVNEKRKPPNDDPTDTEDVPGDLGMRRLAELTRRVIAVPKDELVPEKTVVRKKSR